MIYMEIETGIAEKCRGFPRALNESVKAEVKNWHDTVFPGHFKAGAARKYGYKPRNRRYQRQKQKKGSPPALVFSGYSKKILNMHIRVTGTKGHVKGKFTSNAAMRYFWMRPKGHPNKPSEMKAMTNSEVKAFTQNTRTGTAKRIRAIRARKKIK